ncbi:unnamed protein product [Rotaria sp. Silwood2]|nr:unnamed protein product [Rotaria sp. Silwood2]
MRTDMTKATFVGTIFYACTLAFATLVDIDLRLNTFHYSNLSYANMTGATLLYDQLTETLSLHNAIFPNRTLGTAKKPLMRFTVQCNASVPEQWHIHGRNIAVKPAEDKCVFAPALNNNSVISMKRNITVEKYYSNLISAECAVLNVQARIGRLILNSRMEVFEIIIKFLINPTENNSCWVESIDLDLDIRLETP